MMSLRLTSLLCVLLALPICSFITSVPTCLRRGAFDATTTKARLVGSTSFPYGGSSESSPRGNTKGASRTCRVRTTCMAVGDGTAWDAVVEFFESLQKGSFGSTTATRDASAKAEAEAKIAAEIAAREAEEMAFDGTWVMMNGLPGKMGFDVAAACLRKGFRVAPYALTGPEVEEKQISVDDQSDGGNKTDVELVPMSSDIADVERAISEIKRRCCGGHIVAVDYTHPAAVNGNAELYAKHGLNFVMGTTGGDREALMSVTEESGVYAVIAPNMGKQIVALQTAIELMAKEFPRSFGGYKLEIMESHQSSKADTSGTAKALAADFGKLTGEAFDVEGIVKVRDREAQLEFGVPEEHLEGHAFHTYSLKGGDGTVEFQFRHNVCGRRMYADGTADAVEFIASKAAESAEKRVYNMVDILKEGGI